MAAEENNSWIVYIIQADDGSLYTGITTNLIRRWQQHCSVGQDKASYVGYVAGGAKYFRGRNPQMVVYVELQPNRSAASARERAIKQLTRHQKLGLLTTQTNLTSIGIN